MSSLTRLAMCWMILILVSTALIFVPGYWRIILAVLAATVGLRHSHVSVAGRGPCSPQGISRGAERRAAEEETMPLYRSFEGWAKEMAGLLRRGNIVGTPRPPTSHIAFCRTITAPTHSEHLLLLVVGRLPTASARSLIPPVTFQSAFSREADFTRETGTPAPMPTRSSHMQALLTGRVTGPLPLAC